MSKPQNAGQGSDSQADKDRILARRGRMVALVIAGAGLAALFAPVLVSGLGLPLRYEFLIYLAAMAAFVWALAVSIGIWRARRD
ncbi:MAG: DUF5337 domain-containing protein [Pseudomonadota bacterium]